MLEQKCHFLPARNFTQAKLNDVRTDMTDYTQQKLKKILTEQTVNNA
jgi:hypothetical protein